ncbi:hypothetical protein BgiBS90_019223, partial [Biomphalaria glabrata]
LTITLQELQQKDTKTLCVHGLLANYDTLTLNVYVSNTEYIDMNKNIYVLSVEIGNASAFRKIREFIFTNCSDLNDPFIYCTRNRNTFVMHISLSATVEMNLTDIKVALSHGDLRRESNIIRITSVYDSFHVSPVLNGLILSSEHCAIKVSKSYSLDFCCDQYSHVSTSITMYRNGKVVANGENCVQFDEQLPEEQAAFKWQCNFCNTTIKNIKCQSFT